VFKVSGWKTYWYPAAGQDGVKEIKGIMGEPSFPKQQSSRPEQNVGSSGLEHVINFVESYLCMRANYLHKKLASMV